MARVVIFYDADDLDDTDFAFETQNYLNHSLNIEATMEVG